MNNEKCPCCEKNCFLEKPRCKYGVEYKHTGIIPENIKIVRMGKEYLIEEQLHSTMRDLSQIMRMRFETRGSQRRILSLIYRNQPVTQQQLIEITGITSASMSEQLLKLENSCLITRKKSEEDGRVSYIFLTDEGIKQSEINHFERQQSIQDEYSSFSIEEKTQLLNLMQKLLKSWKGEDK